MSYIISLRPFAGGNPTWFHNSFSSIIEEERKAGRGIIHIHRIWQEQYGYEFLTDQYGFVEGVVFPSEEEATMFLLKWS